MGPGTDPFRRVHKSSVLRRVPPMSDCELTETYSPAAIDMATATSPATPAMKTLFCVVAAAATPTIKLAVETMPSLAPSTAALNHPMRSTRWSPGAGEDDSTGPPACQIKMVTISVTSHENDRKRQRRLVPGDVAFSPSAKPNRFLVSRNTDLETLDRLADHRNLNSSAQTCFVKAEFPQVHGGAQR